ncbi:MULTISPECIES: peptidase inhibitor family I36 protein [Streptomyces]
MGPAWNDRTGSLWNRTDHYVCVWTDENGPLPVPS